MMADQKGREAIYPTPVLQIKHTLTLFAVFLLCLHLREAGTSCKLQILEIS